MRAAIDGDHFSVDITRLVAHQVGGEIGQLDVLADTPQRVARPRTIAAPSLVQAQLARSAGETAPLLFTALSNQFWTADLREPMASLPVTIFKFAMSPYENWQKLAWAARGLSFCSTF